jgi:hypothetical protein
LKQLQLLLLLINLTSHICQRGTTQHNTTYNHDFQLKLHPKIDSEGHEQDQEHQNKGEGDLHPVPAAGPETEDVTDHFQMKGKDLKKGDPNRRKGKSQWTNDQHPLTVNQEKDPNQMKGLIHAPEVVLALDLTMMKTIMNKNQYEK